MNTAPYPALAVANSLLELAKKGGVDDVTPMKLQKLVFFAHGWYLANTDKPLVKESIQAWQYGPVIESLYHDLKGFQSLPVDQAVCNLSYKDGKLSYQAPKVEDEKVLKFLDQVIAVYGKYSAIQLSNLSHEEGSPWHQVYEECGDELSKRSLLIPNELIGEFYSAQLEAA